MVLVTLVVSLVNFFKTGEFRTYFEQNDCSSDVKKIDARLDRIEAFLEKQGFDPGGESNGNDN